MYLINAFLQCHTLHAQDGGEKMDSDEKEDNEEKIGSDKTNVLKTKHNKQPATSIVHNPPADPGSLKGQLLDDNLLRLWRTGANYEQYRPEEDGDVDVS